MTIYSIDIRRYAERDDLTRHTTGDIREAHRILQDERQFGPFRAWVDGREVKGAYHGVTLEDVMHAASPEWAGVADAFERAFTRPFATNPATLLAQGAL